MKTIGKLMARYHAVVYIVLALLLILAFKDCEAQAQDTLKVQICRERGHVPEQQPDIKATLLKPYTVDYQDSTIKVYPIPEYSFKCARCGQWVVVPESKIYETIWRRKKKLGTFR